VADGTKVTRIKAKDASAAPVKKTAQPKAKAVRPKKAKGKTSGILSSVLGYFKGAWYELRQVRWPDRRATWSLTLAVILFSLFFLTIVVLLDTAFKALFEFIIS